MHYSYISPHEEVKYQPALAIAIRIFQPCGHYTLDQRRTLVQNNVTTLFQLHFNVVPTSEARWEGMEKGQIVIKTNRFDR